MRQLVPALGSIHSRLFDVANISEDDFCGTGLKVHPVADFFPLLTGKEFDELCEDIFARGLMNPIVVLADVILDGRNRLRACAMSGKVPAFAPYSGQRSDVAIGEWIMSQNIKLRQLTDDQRVAIQAKYSDWDRAAMLARMNQAEGGRQAGRSRKKVKQEPGEPIQPKATPRETIARPLA